MKVRDDYTLAIVYAYMASWAVDMGQSIEYKIITSSKCQCLPIKTNPYTCICKHLYGIKDHRKKRDCLLTLGPLHLAP